MKKKQISVMMILVGSVFGCGMSPQSQSTRGLHRILVFNEKAATVSDQDCQRLSFAVQEDLKTEIIQSESVVVMLTSTDERAQFFLDADCQTPIESVMVEPGSSRGTFYLQSPTGDQTHQIIAEAEGQEWMPGSYTYKVSYSIQGIWRLLCQKVDATSFATEIHRFDADGGYHLDLHYHGDDATCQTTEFILSLKGVRTIGDFLSSQNARSVDLHIDHISLLKDNETSNSDAFSCELGWLTEFDLKNLLHTKLCADENTQKIIYDIYRIDGNRLFLGIKESERDKTSDSLRPISIQDDPKKILKKIK